MERSLEDLLMQVQHLAGPRLALTAVRTNVWECRTLDGTVGHGDSAHEATRDLIKQLLKAPEPPRQPWDVRAAA